ncbi:MAG: AmmeMemoRadiSam system radical SAM enzyme [candidate division WOR-3 bacterium]
MKIEAKYYEAFEGYVQCRLCPHQCKILPGKKGICRARINEDNKLWAIDYGETTSIALDPIEKKPLYHFYPGSQILSIACNSCNMKCPFCQNWEISQVEVNTEYLSPEMLVKIYKEHPSLGVSYTYTEPLMWFEYLFDAAKLIRENGGKNVLVTNGLINEEPLRELLPLIDAMNIDLKSINPDIYKKKLGGDLDTVKRTIEISHKFCHIEITNLIVTGLNDKPEQIDALIDYVAGVNPEIPLHFSRYYPNYKYTKPPTPTDTLFEAYEKARKKLKYVYLGNVPGEDGSNTYCPKCGALLIERMYFKALIKNLKGSNCAKCGEKINIIL